MPDALYLWYVVSGLASHWPRECKFERQICVHRVCSFCWYPYVQVRLIFFHLTRCWRWSHGIPDCSCPGCGSQRRASLPSRLPPGWACLNHLPNQPTWPDAKATSVGLSQCEVAAAVVRATLGCPSSSQLSVKAVGPCKMRPKGLHETTILVTPNHRLHQEVMTIKVRNNKPLLETGQTFWQLCWPESLHWYQDWMAISRRPLTP